jgi:hypothetical protein
MARVIKTVTYNTRAITFRGRVVFASMGKYVTDFLAPFRQHGWAIENGDEEELQGDSFMVHVPDANRGALIAALATMPDEAFGWFVAWALQGYPDGLGGFQNESRTSIEALRAAAKDLMGKRYRSKA